MEQLEGKRYKSQMFVDRNSFIYRKDRRKKSGGFYLKCVDNNCHGTASSDGVVSQGHNHQPNPLDVETLRLEQYLRNQAATTNLTFQDIYLKAQELYLQAALLNGGLERYQSLMQRARQRSMPKIPKNLAEFQNLLEDSRFQYGKQTKGTTQPTTFYRKTCTAEDGSIIIMFISEYMLNTFKNRDISCQGDGTFKILPKVIGAQQLFTIHVTEDRNLHTLTYCIMSRRTTIAYNCLFEMLMEYLEGGKIISFMCDYEEALRISIKTINEDCDLLGCFFHYSKAICAKAQKLGMYSNTNAEIRRGIKMMMSLAMLPQPEINKGFMIVKSHLEGCSIPSQTANIAKLLRYWKNQWSDKAISVYGEDSRTNNAVENFNKDLYNLANRHSNVFNFLNALKTMDFKKTCNHIRQINSVDAPPRRKTKYVNRDKFYNRAKNDFEATNDISVYLKTISIKLKDIEKMVLETEELSDTDSDEMSSIETSGSDSDFADTQSTGRRRGSGRGRGYGRGRGRSSTTSALASSTNEEPLPTEPISRGRGRRRGLSRAITLTSTTTPTTSSTVSTSAPSTSQEHAPPARGRGRRRGSGIARTSTSTAAPTTSSTVSTSAPSTSQEHAPPARGRGRRRGSGIARTSTSTAAPTTSSTVSTSAPSTSQEHAPPARGRGRRRGSGIARTSTSTTAPTTSSTVSTSAPSTSQEHAPPARGRGRRRGSGTVTTTLTTTSTVSTSASSSNREPSSQGPVSTNLTFTTAFSTPTKDPASITISDSDDSLARSIEEGKLAPEDICVICKSRKICTILECMHKVLCKDCAKKFTVFDGTRTPTNQCPICRTVLTFKPQMLRTDNRR